MLSDKAQLLGTTIAAQVLRILTTCVMARLVSPSEYGLFAMVLAIPGFVSGLGDLGVGRAFVQIRDAADAELDHTGIVLTALIHGVYAVLSVVAGVIAAQRLGDERVILLGILIGATTFVGAIYGFQAVMLNRAKRFAAESCQNAVFAVTQTVTGIAFACAGFGVFALAVQPLVAQLAALAVMLRHQPLQLPRQFSSRLARRMLSYGGRVTAAQYAGNLRSTLTSIIIGKQLGLPALAIYGKGTQVKDLVGQNVLAGFDRVLYPIMAAAQGDVDRLRAVFTRGLAAMAVLCLFGCAWMTVNSRDLIEIALGRQWTGVTPLLPIMAAELITVSCVVMSITLANAVGEPLVFLRFAVLFAAVTLPAVVAASCWNLAAVAGSVVGAQIVAGIPILLWALKRIRLSPYGVLASLAAPTIAAVLAGFAMWYLQSHVCVTWTAILRLTVSSLLGGTTYFVALMVLDRKAVREMWRTIIAR